MTLTKPLRLVPALALALFLAPNPTEAETVEINLEEPFVLAVGQEGRTAGGEAGVLFAAVTGDSRCPRSVTCIWEGDAEIEVSLRAGGEEATLSLHTHGGARYPRQASALGYTLRLDRLDPYPENPGLIPAEQYRATLTLFEGAAPPEDGGPEVGCSEAGAASR